ncbi:pyridoxal phosphate-dependent aminotransferase [Pseudodesulfovibrio sediminis]|uniref:Aminotransferase n=1 Tax=Pseudodesulfovibrio sediminis TaxID=2810563 RepID=A0ABM8I4J0_9BACT|nr:pyridoxal phosphate-dependent aminotransferase [Pseudodesulfovibrio sediminis]BCS88610.1 aminotransferase [Pseudodesulfovibrio sediminis]
MRISDRLSRIKPSATLAVNTKAQELRDQGREIISLAVGQPDYGTPKHVCEAAKVALDEGFTRYTPVPGIPELRKGVADYYTHFYGAKTAPENAIICNGGKQVLYNLLMALVNPGDEVLIPSPYWVSYPAMVQLADGVSVFVPTTAEEEYLVTVEGLEAVRTAKTKVLILNSPSNPTGCCYTQEQLDAIADWAIKNDIFVISDEVYDRLVYAPFSPVSLAKKWEAHPESIAIVGALSKSFCMTGWRVGYALAHADLVKAMVKIQGQSTSNINSITQKAAVAALTGPWEIVDKMKESFVRRRDLAYDIITSWGALCPKPDGAFYLFPVLDQFYTEEAPDSASMCTKILEEAGVALVPGSAFGDDKCIRFSYAVDDEILLKALTKVGNVLTGI